MIATHDIHMKFKNRRNTISTHSCENKTNFNAMSKRERMFPAAENQNNESLSRLQSLGTNQQVTADAGGFDLQSQPQGFNIFSNWISVCITGNTT